MLFKAPSLILEAIGTVDKAIIAQSAAVGDAQRAATAAKLLLTQATVAQNKLESQAGRLRRLALIERGLPQAVRVLRDEIAAHDRDAEDDDRTGRQQQASERLAKEARAQLVKACPHTFLYHIRKYEGSRLEEYDDAHPGSLTCLVCGLHEEGKSQGRRGDESYEMLAKGDHLWIHTLGPACAKYDSLPKPIPWETIREFFLEADLRRAAAAIGYELK